MADFTHFNDQGRARMVDVGEKDVTHREAVAAARVLVNRETFDLIRSGGGGFLGRDAHAGADPDVPSGADIRR